METTSGIGVDKAICLHWIISVNAATGSCFRSAQNDESINRQIWMNLQWVRFPPVNCFIFSSCWLPIAAICSIVNDFFFFFDKDPIVSTHPERYQLFLCLPELKRFYKSPTELKLETQKYLHAKLLRLFFRRDFRDYLAYKQRTIEIDLL